MDAKRFFVSVYFGVENLYYNVLDEGNKILPVYKYLVDPLEKRGLPSLPVYLVIILAVILSITALSFLTIKPSPQELNLYVTVTSNGFKVPNADVSMILNGEETTFQTTQDGTVTLKVKHSAKTLLVVNADGFIQKTHSVQASKNQAIEINLLPTLKKANELSQEYSTNEEFKKTGLFEPSTAIEKFKNQLEEFEKEKVN